ncbi:heme exporter protein CcmD [Pelagibacteraceae bacterium]|nr:heme exporter protein CcmD [Pelagibacteraceae bacterium]|tara:strand:+ start:481 stop:714 length:234 start_codon:yes stop_codon:yes gene_type:complete
MIQNFITMNGYGLYVWLSFAISILSCSLVYYRTLKTLKKYERDFAKELNELSIQERKLVLEKSQVAAQVLASYNRSI